MKVKNLLTLYADVYLHYFICNKEMSKNPNENSETKSSYLPNSMRDFNEIFKKNVSYDNIKHLLQDF